MENELLLNNKFVSINEACEWASNFLQKRIFPTNISYLIQYGKVKKYNVDGTTKIKISDLKSYYSSQDGKREIDWKKKLGNDLNWSLSFDQLREKDTTKHVHRLHPYKGKFIPQLVEYFLDDHVDDFKKEVYFRPGDIVLDPFAGSGTTLVQANEMGIDAIGVDVSRFNTMITETKLLDYDYNSLKQEVSRIMKAITSYEVNHKVELFEHELAEQLADFNNKYFPSPDYKYKLQKGNINEKQYSHEKEKEFLNIYQTLVKKYDIELNQHSSDSFLNKWYINNVLKEIKFVFQLVHEVQESKNKQILAVILSRTIRSCRATTHSDLATLKEPQVTTYYCWKHKKICKPLFSIKTWFNRYAIDTIERLEKFSYLRSNANHVMITADSRDAKIFEIIQKRHQKFYDKLSKQKINGIFTSPPYVGQIDYHEQHAYAYDLFGFDRQDELEIGPLYKGKGLQAQKSYVDGISKVLLNCRKYLTDDPHIFLVANDKYNLYPRIAEQSGMKIVEQFKRPVLNRTERDKSPYSEIIFYLKSDGGNI